MNVHKRALVRTKADVTMLKAYLIELLSIGVVMSGSGSVTPPLPPELQLAVKDALPVLLVLFLGQELVEQDTFAVCCGPGPQQPTT